MDEKTITSIPSPDPTSVEEAPIVGPDPADVVAIADPARQFSTSDEGNIAGLVEAASVYLPPSEVDKVIKAYRFALAHHAGQRRKSGEAYINHPVEVAIILAKNLHSDVDILCAGLLHDTIEDTDATHEDVAREFGEQVALLVDGVTKLTNINVSSLSEQQAQNLRKMFLAMAEDIRVVIIKLADRLHNMRTLMAIPEDRRIFKSHETMEIYAQLANRLGINSIKWELEDLSFYYLEPAKYRQIARMVAESREEREAYLEKSISILRADLEKAGLTHFRITGRPKHLWSIYQKMKTKSKDFSEIYDLIALRVITEDVRDCYGVLGAVHSLWTPMPGRFKDYISLPKNNMYQSLHTTVIGPVGRPLEIQIRTEAMHQQAEYGIAAHWLYKQAGNSEGDKANDAQRLDSQLAWLGRTLDWTQEADMSDPQEFLDALKIDLFDQDVFVFTPAGEVQILRAGSTPIDFAYAVHTEVGNHCIGAKVNGSVVPLTYSLQMGDRVEIMTSNNAHPSRDWLTIVKTPSARQKIRSYFSKITKADDSVNGRDMLAHELRKVGLGISTPRTVRAVTSIARSLGYPSADELYVAIANNKLSGKLVCNRVRAQLDGVTDTQGEAERLAFASLATPVQPRLARATANERKKRAKSQCGVLIDGGDTDMLTRLAHCCNPVMGDDIVGFITRGRGVSVHRADCPNVESLKASEGRMIDVRWDDEQDTKFTVEIVVEAMDRARLLMDVSGHISDSGANIASCGVNRPDSSGVCTMRFLVELSSANALEPLLANLHRVNGIIDARRALPGANAKPKKGHHH